MTLNKYICKLITMKAIEKFLIHFNGNQSKAAASLGKKQQNVWHWLNKSDMPLEYVPKAAEIMGKRPSFLRPDIFKD